MSADPLEDLIIEPGRSETNYWRDLWRFRELFYILAWRDIMVRYKQTVIGMGWALLRPLITMLVFTFLRKVGRFPAQSVPEPIYVFAAVLPWQFFASALSESSNSLISNSNLISKIYFPRLLIPASSIVTSLVDFLLCLTFLALLMAVYGYLPGPQLFLLPALVLITFVLSTGAGVWLAALNVEYRDFRYVVPFIVQFGLFLSPVAISTADVPTKWRCLYALNPMVGIIDAFRWAICKGSTPIDLRVLVLSLATSLVLLVTGIFYFRRMEKGFADII
jgi:lipopolysaccharide transport system permease protein